MYDDYMQNVMGMQMNDAENTYDRQMMGCMPYGNWQDMPQMQYGFMQGYQPSMSYMNWQNEFSMQMRSEEDIESMYPDIYNIIYPMVKKACNQNVKPITRELIDEMAQDIYSNLEADNIINLNINVENVGNVGNSVNRGTEKNDLKQTENRSTENRHQEDRRIRREPIFDLIKILLIRELIDRRPGNRPRPPRPPMPPRPGYPGRPPRLSNW